MSTNYREDKDLKWIVYNLRTVMVQVAEYSGVEMFVSGEQATRGKNQNACGVDGDQKWKEKKISL